MTRPSVAGVVNPATEGRAYVHEHPAAVVSVACTAAKCGRARNGDDGLCVLMHIEATAPPLPSARANARTGVSLRPVGVESTSVGGPIGHPPACTDKQKKCACICTHIQPKKSRAWRARAMRHAQGGAEGAYGGSERRRPLTVNTSTFDVRGGSAEIRGSRNHRTSHRATWIRASVCFRPYTGTKTKSWFKFQKSGFQSQFCGLWSKTTRSERSLPKGHFRPKRSLFVTTCHVCLTAV